MNGALDAHCHLSDERLFPKRRALIEHCTRQGVKWFVLGGVDPKDWQQQQILKQEYPRQIFCSFGLHPYFVSKAEIEELDGAFVQLQNLTNQCALLGEMGLDFRKEILRDRESVQKKYFQLQLNLARETDKPVVLHVVRAHEPALQMLRTDRVRGMVHAFNSSWEIAQKYLDLGLYLSVGAYCLGHQHRDLLRDIPMDQLLIESDAPDQPPRGQKEHDPTTVLLLAQAVADNKGLTPDVVLEKTRHNMQRLLGETLGETLAS